MKFQILTFNWHEPYLCLLARTGYRFDVLEPELGPGSFRRWDLNMRPLPQNVRLTSPEEARKRLEEGEYDFAISHNIKDLLWLKDYQLPKIATFHCRLTTEMALSPKKVDRVKYLESIRPLLGDVKKVFISDSKRADWGLEGVVIPHGLDVHDYGGYTGEKPVVLRVGNLFKEMDLARGYTVSEQILRGFPHVTLGLNPGIPEARLSRGFDDLLNHYRTCRVYLNTTPEEYEDGYNLSMLEAMAAGMPVVTLPNSTSPILDGVNGFVSGDLVRLRKLLVQLLEDRELAERLGRAAQDTVMEKFGMQKFLRSWHAVLQDAAIDYLKRTGFDLNGQDRNRPFNEISRKNVLMNYVSHPATTAHYLERALRKRHNVVTCGPMINDEVKRRWNLSALKCEPKAHDLPCGPQTPLSEVIPRLPERWRPDFFLWVETGLDSIPPDLDRHKFLKVCYLIDTHLHLEKHKQLAQHFDFVFLAQRKYVDVVREAGSPHVFWLPLACDPEIHCRREAPGAKWDVGFVGTVDQAPPRRKFLLDRIASNFHLNCDRKFMEEMAELYSRSRIVFNNAIHDDLNMRVFEGMCSGSLLVTDRAPGSGLDELFQDRKHLVLYEDGALIDTLRHYLDHPEERERIARAGMEEVLAHHTYEHRIETMIATLNRFNGQTGKVPHEPLETLHPADDKPDSYYQHVRHDVLQLIPEGASCILEVGCAAGKTGEALKNIPGVFVAGVELDPVAAEKARKVLDDVVEGNIESMELPYAEKSFDCVLFADVLEHLVDPWAVLRKTRKYLKPGGTVIASIPNVQYYGVLHQVAEGRWTYESAGILDRTHLRFFTRGEIEKLFAETGYTVERIEETLDRQYERFLKPGVTSLTMGRVTVQNLTPGEMRQFFVYQYRIVATVGAVSDGARREKNTGTHGKPSPKPLLDNATRYFANKQYREAGQVYQSILDQFPECAEAWVGKGNCQMHLANVPEAERCFQRAVSSGPGNWEAWLAMGLLQVQKGMNPEALDSFCRTLELNPQCDRALCGLGLVYTQMNRLDEAMEYFIQALHVNIENGPAMKHLLSLSYGLNRFEESERILQRYLELHPANLNILFGLAGIQYRMGRMDEARESLATILVFDSKHIHALDLMNRIEAAPVTRENS